MANPQNNSGWRPIKEVNPTRIARATNAKTANSETGDPGQAGLTMGKRKTMEVDKAFFATGKCPAQTQKTLPMLAKSVEPCLNGPVIRPHWLVAFKSNIVLNSIRRRIAAEQQSQFS